MTLCHFSYSLRNCFSEKKGQPVTYFSELMFQLLISFFYLGFTALSRIFHLCRADCSSKVGENGEPGEKPPDHS